jgi:DNA-binding beta-propeller fold protein YncE
MTRLLVLTLFTLLGCAGPQEVKRRYFFPPPPSPPKIESIGIYATQYSFPRDRLRRFMDTLGGEAPMYFDKPWGISSNGKGRVYVTDLALRHVMVYDFGARTVNPLGMGKIGEPFLSPAGVVVDDKGNIYVSDSKKNRVFAFTKDEEPLSAIGSDETLDWPAGVAVDNELKRLYVVNSHKHNVAAFELSGRYLFSIGKRGRQDGEFNFPTDVDIDSRGNIVVTDTMNARVQVFDRDGNFLRKFGQRGDGLTDFQVIKGVAIDRKTDNIYVVDGMADRVLVFGKGGEVLLAFGGSMPVQKTIVPGGFFLPQDISIGIDGTIYVVDSLNRRFQVFQIVDEEWLKEHPLQ